MVNTRYAATLRLVTLLSDNPFPPSDEGHSSWLSGKIQRGIQSKIEPLLQRFGPTKLYVKVRYMTRPSGFFVSLGEEMTLTHEWIKHIPTDFDLVVGVPKAGLLEGYLIATELGKPLTTPELFARNEFWPLHVRGIASSSEEQKPPLSAHSVLLVDDSVGSGATLGKVEETLRSVNPNMKITKAALFVTAELRKTVDSYSNSFRYHGSGGENRHIFEHDLMDDNAFWSVGSDVDGVLCEQCPPSAAAGQAYREWLMAAKPYRIPKYQLDLIVTGRLKEYEDETKQWLKEHEVSYRKLFMRDDPSISNQRFKAQVLGKEAPELFWESEVAEATYINKTTGVRVLCFENMRLYT